MPAARNVLLLSCSEDLGFACVTYTVSKILAGNCLVRFNSAALSVEHQDNVLVKIRINVISDLKGIGCACFCVDVVSAGLVYAGEITSCDLGLRSRIIGCLGELALPCDLACLCVDHVEIFLAFLSLYENGLLVVDPVAELVDGDVEVRGESLDLRRLCIGRILDLQADVVDVDVVF